MNVHQPILPTTTTIVPNVFVLGTQAMNLSTSYTTSPVNYQITWSQLVTPIVLGKISMSPISIGTKGLDSSIFRNYTSYVFGYLYLVLEQLVVPPIFTPQFVGNQFPIMVQLVSNKERQLVQ